MQALGQVWGRLGLQAELGLEVNLQGGLEMDDREQAEALRNRRLLWLCGFVLAWELIGRPMLALYVPDLELPPSLLRELLQVASTLSGLSI